MPSGQLPRLVQQGSLPLLPARGQHRGRCCFRAVRIALCPAGGGTPRRPSVRAHTAVGRAGVLGLYNSALLSQARDPELSFLREALTQTFIPLFHFQDPQQQGPTRCFLISDWLSPCSCSCSSLLGTLPTSPSAPTPLLCR